MPSASAAALTSRVISMSSREGLGSPEGWLCRRLLSDLQHCSRWFFTFRAPTGDADWGRLFEAIRDYSALITFVLAEYLWVPFARSATSALNPFSDIVLMSCDVGEVPKSVGTLLPNPFFHEDPIIAVLMTSADLRESHSDV
jgi:hypothetical protein